MQYYDNIWSHWPPFNGDNIFGDKDGFDPSDDEYLYDKTDSIDDSHASSISAY